MSFFEELRSLYSYLVSVQDDGSYHMELILALANLRAKSYGIPEVDKERAKIVARSTTPEGASTGTATLAGLACLELYKVVKQGRMAKDYRYTIVHMGSSHEQATHTPYCIW